MTAINDSTEWDRGVRGSDITEMFTLDIMSTLHNDCWHPAISGNVMTSVNERVDFYEIHLHRQYCWCVIWQWCVILFKTMKGTFPRVGLLGKVNTHDTFCSYIVASHASSAKSRKSQPLSDTVHISANMTSTIPLCPYIPIYTEIRLKPTINVDSLMVSLAGRNTGSHSEVYTACTTYDFRGQSRNNHEKSDFYQIKINVWNVSFIWYLLLSIL